MKKILIIPLIILLAGCNPEEKNKNSDSMVLLGETIYNKNCVSCHGPKGQGLAKDWKVKDENGNYPAHHLTEQPILGIIRPLSYSIQLTKVE